MKVGEREKGTKTRLVRNGGLIGQPPTQLEASMLNRLARRIEDLRSSTAPTVDAVSHETFEE